MNVEQAKKLLMAKAKGQQVEQCYCTIKGYNGNIISKEPTDNSEDIEVIIINNKKELEEYETKNLHR